MLSIVKYFVAISFLFVSGTRVVVVAEDDNMATCPPTGFDSLKQLDFDGYIEKRWYSIKQIVVPYQPENQFYCVFAEYTKITKTSWWCRLLGCTDPPTIRVFNSARRGSVTGRVNSINFEAVLTDTNEPAKALVTPNIVPRTRRRGSNYWVVAAGKFNELPSQLLTPERNDEVYDYAIITTALPETVGTNGSCYSNGGMWIFSRIPEVSTEILTDIESIAEKLGLAVGEWKPVEHEGCVYEGTL